MINLKFKPSTTLIALLPLASIIFYCCDNKDSPKIYINTTTVKGNGDNEIRKDTITTVISEYFNVNLKSMKSGQFYIAGETVREVTANSPIDLEFFDIVDEKGNTLEFKNSAEFLNFMGERGYEMKNQEQKKFSFKYTFKRKE